MSNEPFNMNAPAIVHPEGRCRICGKELDNINDPTSGDCGGDCVQCMADSGDPDCIAAMKEVKTALQIRKMEMLQYHKLVPCPFCSKDATWQTVSESEATNTKAGCRSCDVWLPVQFWNQRMFINLPVENVSKISRSSSKYGFREELRISIAEMSIEDLQKYGIDLVTLQKAMRRTYERLK